MIRVTFIEPSGSVREIEGPVGTSLMELAVKNSVVGIEAECGGACSCATCHVYVDQAWTARVGEPRDMEESMLEFADGVRTTSRLSCQIKMTVELDGLTVQVVGPLP
jgi:2Fe-2S ferredoxin